MGERRIEGRFMTQCFATWQKGRRKLRIANAGQSQPLLWRKGRCEKLPLSGLPLGIYDDVSYDEWGVVLDPGDILVFHSDGLADSADPAGQFYGSDRLREAIAANASLSASALADLLFADVAQFSEGLPLADDRTLVVLKVK